MRAYWRMFALSLCFVTSLGAAQEGYARPAGREHRGFFARVSVGVGYTGLFARDRGAAVRIGGASLLWNLAIGASVTERLALHAVYFSGRAFNARMRIEDDSYDYDSVTLMTHNLGVGMTYYTPTNWYLSPQLGFAVAAMPTLSANDMDVGLGFALGGIFGKEWFVARDLGLGVAAQLNFLRVYVDPGAARTGFGAGPMISLTYN